jgi:catechol 2,3-dioxygenase-like lactoylglutathione lyase family enzyme
MSHYAVTYAGLKEETTVSRAPGIHSIGEFALVVPKLEQAEHFYGSFGLRVSNEDNGMAIRAERSDHRWGIVTEGTRKFQHHMSFLCFEEDLPEFKARLARRSIPQVNPPKGFDGDGIWFHDHDGFLTQIRVGPKTSPYSITPIEPTPLLPGVRNAPYRRHTGNPRIERLSHVLRFTPNVERTIDFYTGVLGMRLSDRSADQIVFFHGIHGSDHHMMAFLKADRPGFHHVSWIVPSVDAVGLGSMHMADKGYTVGWGTGRHVLGSNYFYYVRDPWGAYSEYACGIDFVPAGLEWKPVDHLPEDGFYLWGPNLFPEFGMNFEESPVYGKTA